MQTKAARIAELEGLLEAVTAHRDETVERLAGVQKAAAAVEALRLEAEGEAEAASRAAQEADRRTQEARADRDLAEVASETRKRKLEIERQRSDDYLLRIRSLEAALLEAPLEGAAMVLRRELEQTQAFLTASRVKSRARGHALAALQESHRKLKLASASKDRRISGMQGELERAGLRPAGVTHRHCGEGRAHPPHEWIETTATSVIEDVQSGRVGPHSSTMYRCNGDGLAPGDFPLYVGHLELTEDSTLEQAQAEEIDRLRRVIEEIAQKGAEGVLRMAADRHADDTIDRLMRERVEVTEAIAELRGLYAVGASDAAHVLKACHEIRELRAVTYLGLPRVELGELLWIKWDSPSGPVRYRVEGVGGSGGEMRLHLLPA